MSEPSSAESENSALGRALGSILSGYRDRDPTKCARAMVEIVDLVRATRPTHSDLCRLSRVFNEGVRLDNPQDCRINEWLSAAIENARKSEERTSAHE